MQNRERTLLIVAGLAVGAWLADMVVIEPYLAWHKRISKDIASAQRTAVEAEVMLERSATVRAQWSQRFHAGLGDSADVLRFRTQGQITAAARDSGVAIDQFGGGQVAKAGPGQACDTLRMTLSGQGSLAQVLAFVRAVERMPLPLRIDRCDLSSSDARRDRMDLGMTMSIRMFSDAARANRPAPAATAPWQAPTLNASDLSSIVQAKPFLSDRSTQVAVVTPRVMERPPVRPATRSVPVPLPIPDPPGWALVGVVADDSGSYAFVRHQSTNSEAVLRLGDVLSDGSATVAALTPSSIIIDIASATRAIAIGQGFDGQPASFDGVRVASVRPPLTPNVGRGDEPRPTPPSTTTPDSSSGDSERERLLQLMRSRRNRTQ